MVFKQYFPELQMVRLFVDTSFIPPATATALGVVSTTPINVSLHFGEEYLECPTPPKFELDQKPYNDLFGLQFQLTEIMKVWVKSNWGQSTYSLGIPNLRSSSGGGHNILKLHLLFIYGNIYYFFQKLQVRKPHQDYSPGSLEVEKAKKSNQQAVQTIIWKLM